jgi:hypothetical protein
MGAALSESVGNSCALASLLERAGETQLQEGLCGNLIPTLGLVVRLRFAVLSGTGLISLDIDSFSGVGTTDTSLSQTGIGAN